MFAMSRDSHHRRPTLRDDEMDPALSEVSRKVIGFAIEIHRTLGPGFDASVYENALANDLTDAGIVHEVGHVFSVWYNGNEVGQHRGSLFIDQRFIVSVMTDGHEVGGFERSALRALLRATDLELGLIINFHRRRLKDGGLVRVLNPDMIDELRGGRDDDDNAGSVDDDEEAVGADAQE